MKIATDEEIAQQEAQRQAEALEFAYLPIEQIVTAEQIRQEINTNAESFLGLMESIKDRGVLEPVLVARQQDGTYRLLVGERRYQACKKLGLTTIPARIIKKADTKADVLTLQLIENLEREDLDPIDEAKAYQEFFRTTLGPTDAASIISLIISYERDPERVKNEFAVSLTAIVNITGKSYSSVRNLLSLLTLPNPFQTAVKEGKIGRTQGYLLADNLDLDNRKLYEIFESILKKPVTYDELKKLLDSARKGRKPVPKPAFSTLYSGIKNVRAAFEKGKAAYTKQDMVNLSAELKAFCALLDEQVQKQEEDTAKTAQASQKATANAALNATSKPETKAALTQKKVQKKKATKAKI